MQHLLSEILHPQLLRTSTYTTASASECLKARHLCLCKSKGIYYYLITKTTFFLYFSTTKNPKFFNYYHYGAAWPLQQRPPSTSINLESSEALGRHVTLRLHIRAIYSAPLLLLQHDYFANASRIDSFKKLEFKSKEFAAHPKIPRPFFVLLSNIRTNLPRSWSCRPRFTSFSKVLLLLLLPDTSAFNTTAIELGGLYCLAKMDIFNGNPHYKTFNYLSGIVSSFCAR